ETRLDQRGQRLADLAVAVAGRHDLAEKRPGRRGWRARRPHPRSVASGLVRVGKDLARRPCRWRGNPRRPRPVGNSSNGPTPLFAAVGQRQERSNAVVPTTGTVRRRRCHPPANSSNGSTLSSPEGAQTGKTGPDRENRAISAGRAAASLLS